MLKNIFLRRFVLSIFLCGAGLLVAMDGGQDQLTPRSLATSQGNLQSFNTLKNQHADEIKLLGVKHTQALEEIGLELGALRQQNSHLGEEKKSLSDQMTTLKQLLQEATQVKEKLIQEKQGLSEANAQLLCEMKSQNTQNIAIVEKISAELQNKIQEHEKIALEKREAIKDLTEKLGLEQESHQGTSKNLGTVRAEHAQALYYKKIFLGAFLACASALIGHILYIHHESLGISKELLTSFKERFA